MRNPRELTIALSTAVIGVCGGAYAITSASGRSTPRASSSAPCGTLALPSTRYTHVIWLWMENHSFNEIVSSPEAPYVNGLARACGLATNYHNISHPSLPNYIAATSGLSLPALKRFHSDCSPSHRCGTSAPSIFGQDSSWKAYEESMPKSCDRRNKGEYAVRHDPPPYYATLSECTAKDVPYTRLAADLSNATLPAFSFVTPNLIDDMHDGTVAQGDSWLASNVPAILGSSEYKSGEVVLFITWDEGEGGSSQECATNTTDVGCHVATIVVSPSTAPATQSAALFNHYSLLASSEQLLGLPALGEAAAAGSMLSAFDL